MFNREGNENGIKINRSNKDRQKVIFYCAANLIFLGEWVAAHYGHQAWRWPLRDVASHVRVKQLLIWTLYPFGRLS